MTRGKTTRRKWTQQRVIAAIQARQQAGLPLRTAWRDDQLLSNTAYRLFGSWREAVLAAGGKPYLKKWTKQAVLEAILDRQRRGLPMQAVEREDSRLYSAAWRHFGCWGKALLAAGLPYKPRRKLARNDVIAAIQERHRQGLLLAGYGREDRGLSYAARKHFGSWRKAVQAAGIPDGWQYKWSRQRVIEALQACAQPGQPLLSKQVSAAARSAAYLHFGSWHAALTAAGLVLPEPRPSTRKKWTPEVVLAEIRARCLQDTPLTVAENPRLAAAARKRFGSWHEALVAAGVKSKPPETWSKQHVLEEIRARHARGALAENDWTEDRALASAARRRFGSWHRALLAAGVRAVGEKPPRKLQWTAQRVIEAIQDRYIRGLPLTWQGDRHLAYAVVRRFGSWPAALAAAGISGVKRLRPRRRWTRQRVIEEIRMWRESGVEMVKIRRVDTGLAAAARKCFGGWHKALAAAGLDAEPTQRKKPRAAKIPRARRRSAARSASPALS
jgi:hypothetical protein